jgi:hypothetical protein
LILSGWDFYCGLFPVENFIVDFFPLSGNLIVDSFRLGIYCGFFPVRNLLWILSGWDCGPVGNLLWILSGWEFYNW